MARLEEIIAFCDELLDIGAFTDYGPNGLQVPGRDEVNRVATCVSAHREAIGAALSAEADLLLAHHGLFWDFHPRSLTRQMASRLRIALGADLSIAGYHLPLDAHPEVGNNALLCSALGFEPTGEELGSVKGRAIGVVGASQAPVAATDFVDRIQAVVDRLPLVFESGPEEIRRIGIVTGSGASEISEAIALGLDAFITGEPAEHAMADAREGGVHFIAAGHYATETFGIRRLGELVSERFDVQAEFIDAPNPV